MNTLSIIFLSCGCALLLTLLLVALLLFAKKRLAPGGKVTIDINGEKQIEVEAGESLLSTLASQKIFLPSACGGSGTCGLCKCRILSGGGSILPTETGFFSRAQQQEQWRLACQVKVRDNMEIQIPQEILGIKKWECEVISNRNVATFIKEITLQLPEGEHLSFRSGGFVQIDIPPITVSYKDIDVEPKFREDWDRMHLWDLTMVNKAYGFRAYSMANHPAEGDRIMLNIRIATPPWDRTKGGFMHVNPGVCSSYLFSRKPGDKVKVCGPFGEFFLKDSASEKIFIGGGAGMAPMRSHLFHLFYTQHITTPVSFWYGARSLQELFYVEEFEKIAQEFDNFSFHIALSDPKAEDHWDGPTGFIHQVLYDKYLSSHNNPEDVDYYLCGPPLMTSAVISLLDDLGVPQENILYDDFGG